MKNFALYWTILSTILLFIGIGFAARNEKSSEGRFEVVPLHNQAKQDAPQRYLAFVPHQKNEAFPVLLFLNGFGENGNDGLFQVSNNFGQSVWRRRNHFPYLTVCPQCSKGGVWDEKGPDTTYALRCLEDAIKRFGGDPKQIYITGVSSGAEGVLKVLSSHPDRFVAALTISFGAGGEKAIVLPNDTPIRCLVNKFDNERLVNDIRSARKKWFQFGSSPLVFEIEGLPNQRHNAWDEGYDSPASLAWLQTQIKLSSSQRGRTELITSTRILDEWDHGDAGIWTEKDGFEISNKISNSSQTLMSPDVHGDSELHFDIHLDSTSRVQVVVLLYDDAATSKSIEFEIELQERGTGGVHNGAGNWFAILEPAAQQALVTGWNEVRLAYNSKGLSMDLNGLNAIELTGVVPPPNTFRWGFKVEPESETRLRYMRNSKRSKIGNTTK